jgi:hypothetical protein
VILLLQVWKLSRKHFCLPSEAKREIPMLPKAKKRRDSGTRSRVSKGPVRDPKHLARVRQEPCLCPWKGTGDINIQAHHVRCIGRRTLGKRVSDYLAVPLCSTHHRQLHKGKEEAFWAAIGVDPAAWIAAFSEEGRAAIAGLREGRDE